jgi:hypothetical protein
LEIKVFTAAYRGGSQFWKGLQAVKEKCLRGLKYVVRNGKKARFWLDVWLGECPLKIRFPILYDACLQQTWSVYQVLHEGVVDLTFRRAFGERELLEWEQLLGMVVFTTASLYRELFFPGVINRELMDVWGASLPLKIKVFVWQVYNDKIQSEEQLCKRNWPRESGCKLCGEKETTDHIIFGCMMARFLWCVCRDAFGWRATPTKVSKYIEEVLEGGNRKTEMLYIFIFGCAAWSLWLIRNDFVFNDLLVSSPEVCIFRFISFMQRWAILCKAEEKLMVDEAVQRLKDQLSLLRSEAGD